MSSYLVAFVVSNYKKITKISTKQVEVNVLARPNAIDDNDGDFALDDAAKVIDFFETYFNVSYPLKKSSIFVHLSILKYVDFKYFLLAQVGIPDFNGGGM
jgi:aminopeptidase N